MDRGDVCQDQGNAGKMAEEEIDLEDAKQTVNLSVHDFP